MVRLSLHRANTTVRKEQPLKLLAVCAGLCNGVPCKDVVLVKLGTEVEEDSGRLEDGETVVCDCGNTAVRVDLLRVESFSACLLLRVDI